MPPAARPSLPNEAEAAALDPRQALVVDVSLGEDSYRVHVGPGLLARVGQLHPPRAGARAAVIAPHTVAGLYANACLQALRDAGWQVQLLTTPDGEEAKTLAGAGELYEGCLRSGLDRGSTIFALGGGVTGDLAGFVAATYLRGLPFVQLPTTLLAQVDASVGGKTAVDLPAGKNLVGAFHQPSLVAIDTETLNSLPDRDLCAGMAEIVKHAAIADAPMFEYLEACSADLLGRDPISLRQIVARNCQIKAEVVAADPHERGLRAVLNYGHTVGHAIEAAAGEWVLRHGEAVAYGMIVEARLAVALGLAEQEVPERLEALLRAFNLAGSLPPVDRARAQRALLHDKKIADGRLKLPVVPRLGEVLIREDIPAAALWDALAPVIAP